MTSRHRPASGRTVPPRHHLATQVFASGEITLDPPGITVTVEEFCAD
jgi:hypothetical protein